jgi:hypothetical protein
MMSTPDQPQPPDERPGASTSAALPVPADLPAPAGDDDIIDAEIVEDPTGADGTIPAAPPVPSSDPAPAATTTPAPATPAPVWGAPPVPSVPTDPITDYTDAGVPTLAYLQDKVEKRYATAVGSHELAEAVVPEAQQAAKRQQELAKSAQERLEEIRRSLHPDA